jgi:hypothetical protein
MWEENTSRRGYFAKLFVLGGEKVGMKDLMKITGLSYGGLFVRIKKLGLKHGDQVPSELLRRKLR